MVVWRGHTFLYKKHNKQYSIHMDILLQDQIIIQIQNLMMIMIDTVY